MQPIRIIDSNFNLLAEIDDYESLQFIRRWYKAGEFELHININKNNTDVLLEDNLIIIGNRPNKVGVIRHREIKIDDQGRQSEELLIKGYTLKGILNRRITVPPTGQGYDRIRGNAETVMKHYVYANCINPEDPDRVISKLALSQDLQRGIYTPWQTRFENLSDVENQIAEYCDIGWDIYLDIENKVWVFEIYEGRDITSSQVALPPVIFSVEFDNIKSQSYVDSALNYSNVGYAGGQGEEEDRLIQQIGDASGLNRIEAFLDCSDSADIDELISNGQQKLSDLKKIENFESQILDFGSFIYGQDWDLGDKITIQNKKWGITLDSRITEVKETYESNGFKLETTFGNNIPTLIDKIKKAINTPLNEKSTLTASDIPTATSQLKNDSGFITAEDIHQVSTYTHEQIASAAEWIITHNLNRYPSVTIVDSAGSVVGGDIEYVSQNEIRVTFSAVFSGKAFLN